MTEPAPLYVRVKDHILGNIRSGQWAPGARVPSENELVESFKISRMTANRALRELTSDGYLARVPGVGTFVKQPPARASLMELRNIADEIAARGHCHVAHVHLRETVSADASLAEEFELRNTPRLYRILIVHLENGTAVQVEDRYVNPAVAPHFLAQDYTLITPTAYLISVAPVEELEHTVEAAMPTPVQQSLLGIAADEPCLTLHRRSWSGGRVVTVANFIYPASRYALYSRYRTSASGSITQ